MLTSKASTTAETAGRSFHPMNTTTVTPEKLSSSATIGFRPGALRKKLDDLHADLIQLDSGLKLSDLLRDGLEAFWPQIEAYLRARQRSGLEPARLAELTSLCAEAMKLGVTPEQLRGQLATLVDQSLAATPGA